MYICYSIKSIADIIHYRRICVHYCRSSGGVVIGGGASSDISVVGIARHQEEMASLLEKSVVHRTSHRVASQAERDV